MKLSFSKMHGAGNDFVVFGGISAEKCPKYPVLIRKICDRRRGIGADGLILISREKSGFRMEFYNCDGSRAGMCGNGLRCAASYAFMHLGAKEKMAFKTDSGILDAEIRPDRNVRIGIDVKEDFRELSIDGKTLYHGNTGVPHLVVPVNPSMIGRINVKKNGSRLRFHMRFAPEGTNVNFIAMSKSIFKIRTYERGVEDETQACGTGIAASAVAAMRFMGASSPIFFATAGSDILKVELPDSCNMISRIKKVLLTGPAVEVYSGQLNMREVEQWR